MDKRPNWEKYPETFAEFDKVRKELKKLRAKREKELVKMRAVGEQIQKLVDKKEALHDKACVDIDEIRNLMREEMRLARAMGAISA
jgi:flagellar biosynthesis/type III secretory pathway chaperone